MPTAWSSLSFTPPGTYKYFCTSYLINLTFPINWEWDQTVPFKNRSPIQDLENLGHQIANCQLPPQVWPLQEVGSGVRLRRRQSRWGRLSCQARQGDDRGHGDDDVDDVQCKAEEYGYERSCRWTRLKTRSWGRSLGWRVIPPSSSSRTELPRYKSYQPWSEW